MESLILGIVQGITEFLPVSSSAHFIIVSWFLSGSEENLILNLALHLGSTLALLLYFHKDLMSLTESLINLLLRGKKSKETENLIPALLISMVPAAIIGTLFQDFIEKTFHHPLATAFPLILVGWLLWWGDLKLDSHWSIGNISKKQALFLGFMQTLALIPGVSRSGITILGGRVIGLNRSDACRFSFLMAIPILMGASILKFKDIGHVLSSSDHLLGFFASFISGLLAIHALLLLVKRINFLTFSIYRTVLALVILYQLL